MSDNKSEEVPPQQGEDLRAKYVPGVWRWGSAFYELRYSSTGVPVLIGQDGKLINPSLNNMAYGGVFELAEPGATLDSPLFRGPHDNSRDDAALLQLICAAISASAQELNLPAAELGRRAAKIARAALAELRRLEALSSEETP